MKQHNFNIIYDFTGTTEEKVMEAYNKMLVKAVIIQLNQLPESIRANVWHEFVKSKGKQLSNA